MQPERADMVDYVYEKLNNIPGDTWRWFSMLSREEWMVVLTVVMALGFLCLRGYGSRSSY